MDHWADLTVRREVYLEKGQWANAAAAFGKNTAKKAHHPKLQRWFASPNSPFMDLLDAARIRFKSGPGPGIDTGPHSRLTGKEGNSLSPQQVRDLRDAILFTRKQYRCRGRKALQNLIDTHRSDEDSREIRLPVTLHLCHQLQDVHFQFRKGFHYWRDYGTLT